MGISVAHRRSGARRFVALSRHLAAAAVFVAAIAAVFPPGTRGTGYTYDIDVSVTSAQVGDTITLTPVLHGPETYPYYRCLMRIYGSSGGVYGEFRMQVASDDCAPWTFVLPPTPVADLTIEGFVGFGSNAIQPENIATTPSMPFHVEDGGTAATFTSNYPVQSWAPNQLVDDPTPIFGEAQTIAAPVGADGCRIYLMNGGEDTWTQQATGCHDWTYTLAAGNPVKGFFGAVSWIRELGWNGTSRWSATDPDNWLLGQRWGETYQSGMPIMTGTGGSFASDVPAVFAPETRLSVYYVDDPTPPAWAPIVVGTSVGSCRSVVGGTVHPVASGGCGTFEMPPWASEYNGSDSNPLELLDADGNVVAFARHEVGFAAHMSALEIDMDAVSQAGADLDIGLTADAGAPNAYVVEVTALGTGTTGTSRGVTADDPVLTLSGEMAVSVGGTGGAVAVAAPGLTPGEYRVSAEFEDVKGATVSSSQDVVIVDNAGPSGSVVINGGAAYTGSRAVSIDVSATDPSGLADVATSNDGTHWTIQSYVTPISWSLTTGDGSKKVWVKWRDTLGNWSSASSDTIGLDTTAPSATAPMSSIRAGGAFASTSIPVRVRWTGKDSGSGIDHYVVEREVDGGPWTTVDDDSAAPTADVSLDAAHVYAFRVQPVDALGHVGGWTAGPSLDLATREESSSQVTFSGHWKRLSGGGYSGGKARAAKAEGAKATLRTTAGSVGFVSRLGPTRGKAIVIVDGKTAATINLHAGTSTGARIVWSRSWTTAGKHKVVIKVVGTHGHPSVVADAFVTSS